MAKDQDQPEVPNLHQECVVQDLKRWDQKVPNNENTDGQKKVLVKLTVF